jgi:hypothetical protein
MILLSEQQLVDCAAAFNNHGCNGGLPSQAFEYVHYNGGLSKMEEYPYGMHILKSTLYSPKYSVWTFLEETFHCIDF